MSKTIDQFMKSFVANPTSVYAGRIERVYHDVDNDDYPFVVWVNGQHMAISEEVCEDIDPEVGDYVVIPKGDGDRSRIIPPKLFHLFYSEIGSRSAESIPAGMPTLN